MSARLPIIDERPTTYGDCLREGWGDHDVTGPCPWVGCAHHLAWAHVARGGWSRKAAEPETLDRSVDRLEEFDIDTLSATCALRAAEAEHTLSEIGDLLDVTRERVRQIETRALASLDTHRTRPVLRALQDEGHEVSRPDLVEEIGYGLSRDEMRAAALRIDPSAVARTNDSRTRKTALVPVPTRVFGPPVRVLRGAERAARIAELKARTIAGAKKESEVARESDKESGRRVIAAIEKYRVAREIARTKAIKELGISTSTYARLVKDTGCTPSLAARVEALAEAGGPAQKSEPKRRGPSRYARPQSAPKVLAPSLASDLARVAAVIDKLGGIDRAERIADAIGGAP